MHDITNTQQASYNYLQPELPNGSKPLILGFSAQITKLVEAFFLFERFFTIFNDSFRKVSRIIFRNKKMETKQ